MTGREVSVATREKQRIRLLGTLSPCIGQKRPSMQGENHPQWIKDRTKLAKRQERNDSAYKEWRMKVWMRDVFKCRIVNQDCNGRLEAHHILGWSLYPELRYNVNNGITLCQFHHPKKRGDEQSLIPTFRELVGSVD